MKHSVHCDVVSAEDTIYSGAVYSVTVDGVLGQMCVLPGHAPLLTRLNPGVVRLVDPESNVIQCYVSGGFLEVQPSIVTILADTAVRAEDIDEAAALDARKQAEQEIQSMHTEMDYAAVSARLAQAVAQLRLLEEMRKLRR